MNTQPKHYKKIIALLVAFLLLVLHTNSQAQDLEQIGKKDAIKMNGSLSLMNIFYAADGIKARRPPSTWFVNGNVTFNLYGWTVPLSMTLSQNNSAFNQPFNQYGLSPKYKWITVHAGYRNMTFSQYTLAGHTFLGGGVELTPKNFKFAAMYGRLMKAVREDTLSGTSQTPSFERWGWGWKAGYEQDGNGVSFNMFHAKDNINSLAYSPEKSDVKPGENLVIGVTGKLRITKQFNVQGEYANSAYTRDIRTNATHNRSLYANLGDLFTYRLSTSNFSAYKLGATYSFLKYSLGATYERIQPGYTTMGAYFFNNDMENLTLNATGRFLKEKLNAGLNLGTQRNNLDKTEINTVRRIIGSVNLSYTPSQKWNFSASYSNFQTSTAIAQRIQQFQNADSLRFFQVSQSANGTVGYNFGSKERKKGIMLNLAYQIAKNTSGGASSQNNDSKFYNGNLSYKYTIVPKNVGMSIGVNANQSELSAINTFSVGPTASLNKSMFKKTLRSSISGSYNNVYNNGKNVSTVLNVAFNNSYVFKKKHTFMLNAVIINREANTVVTQKFAEYTCTVGYTFVF